MGKMKIHFRMYKINDVNKVNTRIVSVASHMKPAIRNSCMIDQVLLHPVQISPFTM